MRALVLSVLVGLAGCAPPPGAPPHAHEAALRAVEIRPIAQPSPEGSDEPPRLEISVETPAGRRSRSAVAAVPFAGGVAWVDLERRLGWIGPGGSEVRIADEIAGRPVSDTRGERLAFAVAHGDAGTEIRVLEAGALGRPAAARGSISGAAAPIALDGQHVALVGSENGGVAGLWLLPLAGGAAECVTNCGLRAGEPWGDAYLPPPGDGASLRIEASRVHFLGADGREHTAPRAGAR